MSGDGAAGSRQQAAQGRDMGSEDFDSNRRGGRRPAAAAARYDGESDVGSDA